MSAKYSLADANKILEEQFNKPNGRFYNVFDDPKKQKDAIERIGCASAHRRGNICFLSMMRQGTPITLKNETQHEVFGGLL